MMQQDNIPPLNTLGDFLSWATNAFEQADLFYGHGTDNAWDEAVAIALVILKLPSDVSNDITSRVLQTEERQQLTQVVKHRIQTRKPLAYLLGIGWFAGEQYIVNEDVIVPRSPFAELIHHQFQPWLTHAPARMLDLCTGSGCIAIASQKAFPHAKVVASDISKAALAVAKKNCALHQVEQLQLVLSDLFANIEGTFDLIVSNPPYVGMTEWSDMPAEYHREPKLALLSAEEGLLIPKTILQQAAQFLTPHGLLFLEVGYNWQALEEAYPNVPFTWVEFEFGGEGICVFEREKLLHYFSSQEHSV